ncbi:MAG TPA: O-antigen ligase family protein, partial [Pyrinomonadaceae bacterium]|nr:O-antigen ligase family protein [Pyrinomonadaceae bacterium]
MDRVIFGALAGLIVLTAVPYGTFDPWWKAAFVCAVFGICIVAIIEIAISGSGFVGPRSILLPMVALSAFAFLQTINFNSGGAGPWRAISADPYQTRFFAIQILALTACLALLYRYAATKDRMRVLIHVVIGIAVASALFGIVRQATQHQPFGFVLPMLKRNEGYGQFINKNHFAYLMEMAFGLGLGLALSRGVRRDRLMIYIGLLFPIWIALVLSNSRGGILAMLAQIVLCAFLLVRRQTSRLIVIVLLIAGILAGTIWVGGDRLASNLESASTDFAGDTTRDGASRNEIWRATLKMFAAHPIAGVGFGGYWIAITAYHDASGALTPQEAHNEYLEVLSSGGLIGFGILVWFAVMVVRRVHVNLITFDAVRFGAVVGITGVVVHSLVDFGLHL